MVPDLVVNVPVCPARWPEGAVKPRAFALNSIPSALRQAWLHALRRA